MWEVAALAGMRTILVFYLVNQLHFLSSHAVEVYGLSTAASFVMSMIGGAIADRFLGIARAVVFGALILAIGHFALAYSFLLYPSLALIAIGSGLFRPSLIAQVWMLYDEADPRARQALLLYKLGCNLGGIFGPIVCGALYELVGWGAAVVFCGGGMLVSVLIFVASRHLLPKMEKRAERHGEGQIKKGKRFTRRRLMVLLIVGIGASFYWTVANQQGGTLALWTYESVNRDIHMGKSLFTIPAAWFQTLNPIMILLFTPVISWLWSRDGGIAKESTELRRMVAGSLMLVTSFVVLSLGCFITGSGHVHWLWLALAIAPMTLGEIYLDSMGQAFFCRQAPPGYLSTFLSLWFVTLTVGFVTAGWLGELWIRMTPAPFFIVSALIAVVGAIVIACARVISRRDLDA